MSVDLESRLADIVTYGAYENDPLGALWLAAQIGEQLAYAHAARIAEKYNANEFAVSNVRDNIAFRIAHELRQLASRARGGK